MIGTSVEHSMQEHHRGVRERLGMGVRPKPALIQRRSISPPPAPSIMDQRVDDVPVQTWSMPAFKVQVETGEIIDSLNESVVVINNRWRDIVRQVCEKHGVSTMDIRSRHREQKLVAARHEAFYRLRMETSMSYHQIGLRMGGFDHTSVYHGYMKHKQKLEDARQTLEAMGE